ncbi:MAG: ribose 5-phosphate isomerase B [Bryobacteraceae bacterium]|jgi:ribose 5-phosphate isomerase B
MRIAIGADHAGFVLKEKLRRALAAEGHQVTDLGTDSEAPCDYPDFARAVAREVSSGACERGVLVCSTGIGMAIAANKVEGVRAAPAECVDEVRLTREHNDANVLTLGARYVDEIRALDLAHVFLSARFAGGRHARRLEKIAAMERDELPATP